MGKRIFFMLVQTWSLKFTVKLFIFIFFSAFISVFLFLTHNRSRLWNLEVHVKRFRLKEESSLRCYWRCYVLRSSWLFTKREGQCFFPRQVEILFESPKKKENRIWKKISKISLQLTRVEEIHVNRRAVACNRWNLFWEQMKR